jgi:hypothetical protein
MRISRLTITTALSLTTLVFAQEQEKKIKRADLLPAVFALGNEAYDSML